MEKGGETEKEIATVTPSLCVMSWWKKLLRENNNVRK